LKTIEKQWKFNKKGQKQPKTIKHYQKQIFWPKPLKNKAKTILLANHL
jgi:hypothetical protein